MEEKSERDGKKGVPIPRTWTGGGDKVAIQTTGPELWNSPPADPRQADSLTLLVCHQTFKDIISEMIYVEWDEVKPYSNQPKPVACTSASIVSSTQQASTSTSTSGPSTSTSTSTELILSSSPWLCDTK